ncbi:hypothetical protein [Draconibacterium orientale]|uniref:hypothetical protein n=1 Tax=Draconibacterium orientale TaxID=1168034 RepID=UPI002A0A3E2B|nr:hypothetical protein [Draconibacterium orientale]
MSGRFSVCAVKLAEIKRRMSSDKKFFIGLKLLDLPNRIKNKCKKQRHLHKEFAEDKNISYSESNLPHFSFLVRQIKLGESDF